MATLVTVAGQAAILRPREAVQPQPCRLPGLHPAQGDGREKVGHHPQRASRQYHAQGVALADHSAWLQGGDFPQVPRNRGAHAGLVDGVGQAGERRLGRADVAVKPGDLAVELR